MFSMEQQLFSIGSADIRLWHVLVAVAAIVVIAVIVVIACVAAKRKKARAERSDEQDLPQSDEQNVAASEAAVSDSAQQDAAEPAVEPAPPRRKVYHVSMRRDGKWQVKLGMGAKAIKLFNTQAEAIDFANEKKKNQGGNVVVHRPNGKIRKQRY